MNRKRNKRVASGWALLFVLGCGVNLVSGWGGSDYGWNGSKNINGSSYKWSFGDVLPGVGLSFDTKDINRQITFCIDCHGSSQHI